MFIESFAQKHQGFHKIPDYTDSLEDSHEYDTMILYYKQIL